MSCISREDVEKISHLARLKLSEDDIAAMSAQLSNILQFVAQMNDVDTKSIEPLAHPLDITQRLRPDVVTEIDQREKFQACAPATENGLYLVPQVIE